MIRHLTWILIACCLVGCFQEQKQTINIPPGAVYVDGRVVRKTPVVVYPEAVTVKLFVSEQSAYSDNFKLDEAAAITLSSTQRAKVASAFSYIDVLEDISHEHLVAACFDPHHFFRYYDASGRMIGEIRVCFCCDGTQMEPGIFTNKDYDGTDQKKVSDVDQSVLYELIVGMGLNPLSGCD